MGTEHTINHEIHRCCEARFVNCASDSRFSNCERQLRLIIGWKTVPPAETVHTPVSFVSTCTRRRCPSPINTRNRFRPENCISCMLNTSPIVRPWMPGPNWPKNGDMI
jgi:hypothetical protein